MREDGPARERTGRRERVWRRRAAESVTTIVDLIEAGEIDMVINIPRGRGARSDGYEIRRAAIRHGIPAITTMAAAQAVAEAVAAAREGEVTVTALQDIHPDLVAESGSAGRSRAVSPPGAGR